MPLYLKQSFGFIFSFTENFKWNHEEAAAKIGVLKILENLQENTCARVSFLNHLQNTSQNTLQFTEHFQTTGSDYGTVQPNHFQISIKLLYCGKSGFEMFQSITYVMFHKTLWRPYLPISCHWFFYTPENISKTEVF